MTPVKSDSTRIQTSIDFEVKGKQTGYLRLPYSSHESAYGWLPLPVACLNGADGPTVLLLGGVHGDEYEGQIVLARLIRELAPQAVRGRLIVLPSTNMPAAAAHNRLSPLDNTNLNRAFPGLATGSPTQMIAHFVEEVLLPRCDAVIDLHSGGSSLEYLPCVRARLSPDSQLAQRTVDLVRAFNAPIGVLFRASGAEPRTLSAACERKGVAYINPETGGGARVDRAALSVARAGVRNCLQHLGVLAPDGPPPVSRSRLATLTGPDSLVHAEYDGLFEPLVDLGDEVRAGQEVAAIHDLQRPWERPEPVVTSSAGTVLCKRVPGRVRLGDCLYELGADYEVA